MRAGGVITGEVARAALSMLEIDDLGLDEIDRRVLSTIIEKFDGGPVGIETIAAAISEEADTIMDVYEPYLLAARLSRPAPRGGARSHAWAMSISGWLTAVPARRVARRRNSRACSGDR